MWPLLAMIALPLLAAVLVVTAREVGQVARLAIAGSAATWAVTVVAAVGQFGFEPARASAWGSGDGLLGVSFALSFDALAAAVVVLATSVGLLVQIYSSAYLAGDPRYRSYAAIVTLFGAAMNTVVLADDLVVLLIGWEVMGVCSYLLISHHWELPAARDGAAKALVMTRFADLGLLVAIVVLSVDAGTTRISEVLAAVRAGALGDGTLTAVALLLVLAVVGKSAQFPLSIWLPDAMPGPTPVSALIHAATMVAAGVYLITRTLPLVQSSLLASAVLGLVACATMLMAAAFALTGDDVKRVLAWSTVSQLAYMFAALAVGSALAATGHLLVHGAFKALLFLGAGSLAHAVGSTAVSAMGGLRRPMRWTFWSMTAGLAALVGLVPTAGFFSKDAVLGAAYEATHSADRAWLAWTVLGCGLLAAVLTAAYATRLWLLVFFGEPAAGPPAHEAPPAMRLPVAVLVVPTLLLGPLVLEPRWLGAVAEPFHWSIALLTTALVVSTALLVRAWWAAGTDPAARLGRLRPLLARELGMDAGWDRAVVRPVRGASRLAVAGDTDVVDAYVRGTAWSADRTSWLLGRAQTRNAVTYVGVAAAGVAAAAIAVGLLG
jgi:NADH-quinone oxidoreductase subunit L